MTLKRMVALGLLGSGLSLGLPPAHADIMPLPPIGCQPDVRTVRPRGPVVLKAGATVLAAGLRPGDELVTVDGRPATDAGVLEGVRGSRPKVEYERAREVDSTELVRDTCIRPAASQAEVCQPDMTTEVMQSFVVLAASRLAHQQGLRKGDHILFIDGKPLVTGRSLDDGLWMGTSGSKVNVTIWQRETGQRQELQLIRERCVR